MPSAPSSTTTEAPIVRWAELDLRVHLLVSTGSLVGARTALEGAGDVPELAPGRIDLALSTGDLSTARRLLDGWRPGADDHRSVVRRLLRASMVLEGEGRHRAAESALTEAVSRAEEDHLRWPFLEVPAALRALRRGAHHPSALTHDSLWALATRLHPLFPRPDRAPRAIDRA